MTSFLPINVEDLLHRRGVESARVEFKPAYNSSHDPTAGQVLETICAFANDFHNLNGGYVVIGVWERDGTVELPPAGVAPEHLDRLQKLIAGTCRKIEPPYLRCSHRKSSTGVTSS